MLLRLDLSLKVQITPQVASNIMTYLQSKNKRRKKKKKTRASRKAEEKRAAEERAAAAKKTEGEAGEDDSGVEVEYVQEKPLVDITNPLYSQFHKIFETFKVLITPLQPVS